MPRLTYNALFSLECTQSGYIECYIASWMWTLVPTFLLFVGVIGNGLNLIILSSKQLRKKSTCVYLSFLAVTDTLYLCSSPLVHTIRVAFGVDIRTVSSFICSILAWINLVCGLTSCWIIVMVTAERALVTLFPTTFKTKSTCKTAVISSVSLVIFFVLLNGHLIYGNIIIETEVNITENNLTSPQTLSSCTIRPGNYLEFFNGAWSKLFFIIGSVLPLILIVLGNAIVAISLLKSRRTLRRVHDNNGEVVSQRTRISATRNSNYKMFFILCTVYIGTTVPFGIYVISFPINKEVDEYTFAKYQLTAVLIRCIIWSNFSFNFFLYFMTGSLFRKEFKRLYESIYKTFSAMMIRNTTVQSETNNDI